jgi:biotin synthase
VERRIAELGQRVLEGGLLGKAEALELARLGGDELYDLFYWANRIRIRLVGRQVKLCAIVAGKLGGCSEDCRFCAQSAHHSGPAKLPSRTSDQDILRSSQHAAAGGASSFGIVNSGRAPTPAELRDWLKPLLTRLASDSPMRLCASLGALTREAAGLLWACGVRRINHNLETSERFYPSIATTHSYAQRLDTLRNARAAGLSLCSGGIFGMGESWEDRIDLLLTLRAEGVDVVPLNFLNPIPGTPLGARTKLAPMECLQVIAIARFVLADKELKVAGGREVCLRDLQSWMFFAGADSTMIGNYLTTCGRGPELDHQMIRDLGLQAEAPAATA